MVWTYSSKANLLENIIWMLVISSVASNFLLLLLLILYFLRFFMECFSACHYNLVISYLNDVLNLKLGLADHDNYHEFCRLLGRFRVNYQVFLLTIFVVFHLAMAKCYLFVCPWVPHAYIADLFVLSTSFWFSIIYFVILMLLNVLFVMYTKNFFCLTRKRG